MRAFVIAKLGDLIPSFNSEQKMTTLSREAAEGDAVLKLVALRIYANTVGKWLKEKREAAMSEMRARTKITDLERLAGRLEVIDEIERELDRRVQRGQDAKLKLKKIKEEENARRTN